MIPDLGAQYQQWRLPANGVAYRRNPRIQYHYRVSQGSGNYLSLVVTLVGGRQ